MNWDVQFYRYGTYFLNGRSTVPILADDFSPCYVQGQMQGSRKATLFKYSPLSGALYYGLPIYIYLRNFKQNHLQILLNLPQTCSVTIQSVLSTKLAEHVLDLYIIGPSKIFFINKLTVNPELCSSFIILVTASFYL